MPTLPELEALVIETVRLLAADFELAPLTDADATSPLYGNGGPLDSMALVNLIADLEDAVAEKYGASITLADEKAMSAKNSPFKDVRSLAKAISERFDT